jgi:hypothetical protein
MKAIDRILGESEPQFSEQFNDTLALFGHVQQLADWSREEDAPSPGDEALHQAIQAYEAKYGSSTLTRDLGQACDDCYTQDDYGQWAMEVQGDLIYNFVRAIKNGEIPVSSLLHSVLSGHALEGDIDLALSAIADRLGWERADLTGFNTV